MSWIKSAVSKAVEVGGRNNLSKTVRNYAGTVVHHAGYAVSEGAKLIHDRIGSRNAQNFKQTVKRLEEVSVSCRGEERVQLLRRWLVALKEVERISTSKPEINNENGEDISEEAKDSSEAPVLVYYYDTDHGNEPYNFRDVFLHSQALEGITLNMILEEPNEEEIPLLLELFGLCLKGGQDIRTAILSGIQDLAKVFSGYQEEVLIKREELLQYAQAAITGLKQNADFSRIDAEALTLKEKLDKMDALPDLSSEVNEKSTVSAAEALKEVYNQSQLYAMMESLLCRKKSIKSGDPPEVHAGKVDKLKVLSESLANSSSKAEKRILENRSQKEEALNFRVAKTKEIVEMEKELVVEIGGLEKQKDDLEAELIRVNSALATARARLHNAREEREQFDDASNQILLHFKSKEDELSRSVVSCRAEADVVNTWIHFLENTWTLRTTYSKKKGNEIRHELETYGDNYVNLVIGILSAYKEIMGSSVSSVKKIMEKLGQSSRSEITDKDKNDSVKGTEPRKKFEEEYLEIETMFLNTMSRVDTIKKQFYNASEGIFRKDIDKVRELFDALEKIKHEFESIGRPTLEAETPRGKSQSPHNDTNHTSPFPSSTDVNEAAVSEKDEATDGSFRSVKDTLDVEADMAKMESELEKFESDNSEEEICDWEFDELK